MSIGNGTIQLDVIDDGNDGGIDRCGAATKGGDRRTPLQHDEHPVADAGLRRIDGQEP